MADRPHIEFPFRRVNGKVAVVEQGTPDHVRSQENVLLAYPIGYRPGSPGFGWAQPVFKQQPLDLEGLRQALATYVPDTDFKVSQTRIEAGLVSVEVK